ncbi:MAG TPA: helix-turn-helix domain-containing protein [Ktedonobacteraceae bacterium]
MTKTVRVSLIEERKRRQWSQQEVADRLGTTRVNISRWEGGQTTPSPYFRARLLALFGKRPQELGLLFDQEEAEQQRIATVPQHTPLDSSHSDLDQSLPLWYVPYLRNAFFTGRESTLQQLHTALHRERSGILSRSCTLSGLGGIGKTQTALPTGATDQGTGAGT